MLLNRPKRFCDESVSSYLYRLAKENYGHAGVLLTRLGITRADWLKNMYSNEQLLKIANDIGLEYSDLLHGTYQKYQFDLGFKTESYYLKNRMKFCPECYREGTYIRTFWGIKSVTICLKHNTILQDMCLNCHSPIIMDQFMNGSCKPCEFSFDKSDSIKFETGSAIYDQQVAFQKALLGNAEMNLEFGFINTMQFLRLADHSFHLLEQLPSFLNMDQRIQIFHNRRGGYQSNEKLANAYGHVYWMYQDFPNRFNIVLTEFFQKPRHKLYVQKEVFERLFEYGEFNGIKAAYEQFWILELEKGTVRKDLSVFKENQALLKQKGHYRKEEIKQLTRISYPKIESLHNGGNFDMKMAEKGNTTQYFIDRISFSQMQAEREKYINRKEAANILGIQRDSVSKLIIDGLIRYVETPYSKHRLILQMEVESLLERSRGKLNLNPTGITFHQVFIKYNVSGLTIPKLLRFIHQDIVHPYLGIRNGSLGDTWYKDEELKRCIEIMRGERRSREGMTMQEVISFLGIGEKKMKRLMDSGALAADNVIVWRDGRKRYFFNKRKVEKFKK